MRPERIEIFKSFTVTLTKEQCEYLEAMFRERLESHQIREKTGYPQDEEGARFAMELWRALLNASSQNGQDRGKNGGSSENGVGKWGVCHSALRIVGALLAAPVFG